MKVLLAISLLLFLETGFAEYRVFELKLSKPGGIGRSILTTLDPYQYTSYYPVDADVSVEYVDSWLCLGDTSYHLDYCKKPARAPANENAENQQVQGR